MLKMNRKSRRIFDRYAEKHGILAAINKFLSGKAKADAMATFSQMSRAILPLKQEKPVEKPQETVQDKAPTVFLLGSRPA